MQPIRILIVLGTRPEVIKFFSLIQALSLNRNFKLTLCVTAQQRQMLDQTLQIFGLSADFDLNIMTHDQDLFDLTSSLLMHMKEILRQTKPDIVLVQGDTTTCFATALSAFYEKIVIGHIEAGLRSNNLYSPFPEEANRVLVSHLANLHFAPTQEAKNNLLEENISEEKIFVTGNTTIDALHYMREKPLKNIPLELTKIFESNKPLILMTGHRRENFGSYLQEICDAIKEIAEKHPEWNIVYPVHLNPHVQTVVKEYLGNHDNIHLICPLDYHTFIHLMNFAKIIVTDSGGIQEEAPTLGKPVLITREVSERPEAINTGNSILVGRDKSKIIEAIEWLMTDMDKYNEMAKPNAIYGDGQAAYRIAYEIEKYFQNNGGVNYKQSLEISMETLLIN